MTDLTTIRTIGLVMAALAALVSLGGLRFALRHAWQLSLPRAVALALGFMALLAAAIVAGVVVIVLTSNGVATPAVQPPALMLAQGRICFRRSRVSVASVLDGASDAVTADGPCPDRSAAIRTGGAAVAETASLTLKHGGLDDFLRFKTGSKCLRNAAPFPELSAISEGGSAGRSRSYAAGEGNAAELFGEAA